MNRLLVAVVAAAGCAAAGIWVLVGVAREPAPSLETALRRLGRRRPSVGGRSLGARLVQVVPVHRSPWSGDDVAADLLLAGRSAEAHASRLFAAFLAGAATPALLLGAAQRAGIAPPGWYVPVGAAFIAAMALPAAVNADLRTRGRQQRRDLRHQLSAFLDVVTMLLAGNVGNEGALRHAASAGDGRLFVDLRRRMTEAEATGRSVVQALGALGVELRIVELQQIAASASLASSEGAPVARSLAAKCATLRSSLASEDEAAARVRTGKLSLPLVGMAIVIMALVMYPALMVTP